ncbi:hypothetical protein FA95DRAFT_1500837 [Auriscalpium vulgare]|uniref:Uncharacterized protein n=1 Tax=Auriscalpium vulgare TaxID=40419 RepID=A0ACB8RCJ8_9AGAM|nr:hypothetical protein FA95DRAFT_1500837 [Auriscalpium vulgare]
MSVIAVLQIRKGGDSGNRGHIAGRDWSGGTTIKLPGEKFNGKEVNASPSSDGVKHMEKIETGDLTGRMVGGGTRGKVYGNSYYGCGYPSNPDHCGVVGRDLSFYFWPVLFYDRFGSTRYPFDGVEVSYRNNSERPGGPLTTLQFQSNQTHSPRSVLYILADNATVTSLAMSITEDCSSYLGPFPAALLYPDGDDGPFPEQAVQYYRGDSAVLFVDGYNNTFALQDGANMTQPPLPLPPTVDRMLLNCINDTIGKYVPLVTPATSWYENGVGVVGLCVVVVIVISLVDIVLRPFGKSICQVWFWLSRRNQSTTVVSP